MKSDKKTSEVIGELRFKDVPEPVIVQGINNRIVSSQDFQKHNCDTFYSCHIYNFEVTRFTEENNYTGGDVRLFTRELDAVRDAFNRSIDRVEADLLSKNKLKRAASKRCPHR